MPNLFSKSVGAVGVAIVLLAAPGTAWASEPSVMDSISSVAPSAVDHAVDVQPSDAGELAVDVLIDQVRISVPVAAADGIQVRAGVDINIGLPFAAAAESADPEAPGIVSYDNTNGSQTVPVVHDDGRLQITTVIESPSAPREYSYELDLPAGFNLVDLGAGAVVLDETGEVAGQFAAPWAYDATGAPVSTRYEVSGSTLTQVVEHGQGLAYPIVADPTYTQTTFWYSRANVEEMWRALNNINNVCQFLPLSYWAGLGCGAPQALANAITQAHYQSKRIKAVYWNCGADYCSYYVYSVVA